MALHYNLAKVYEISENDQDFVHQIANLFVNDTPLDLVLLKQAINSKDYKTAYIFAHKIKPTLDLLGMKVAVENVVFIENWSNKAGKRKEIIETYKNLEDQIFKAIKEISKDFL